MLMVWAAPLAWTVLVFLSNTSTRLIGAFHPPSTQQHSHSCKPREICWRKRNLGGVTVNVCVLL